ncbi:hypothetical protein GCM10017708_06410 [Arthrobacter citreus]
MADGLLSGAHRNTNVDGGSGQGLAGAGQDKITSPPFGQGNLDSPLQRRELL